MSRESERAWPEELERLRAALAEHEERARAASAELEALRGEADELRERLAAETAARAEAETTYAPIVRDAIEGIGVAQDGRIVFLNRAVEAITGLPRQELVGLSFLEVVHPEDRQRVAERVALRLVGRFDEGRTLRFRIVGRDGAVRWVDSRSTRTTWKGEPAVLAFFEDVTERREQEERLGLANASIEGSAEAVFWLGASGEVCYANEAAAALTGYGRDALLRLRLEDLAPPSASVADLALIPAGVLRTETTVRTSTGHYIPIELTASRLVFEGAEYTIVTARDATERKRSEEQRARMEAHLRHRQKLESIGTLASGVAHEINNPVNVVMNYAELIISRADKPAAVASYATEIIAESRRIASIVGNLLAFAHKERDVLGRARISDVVSATLSVVGELLRKDQIEVVVDVPEDLPKIRCRGIELQQVLTNLLANARDALNARYPAHDPDKTIRITAREIEQGGRSLVRTTVEDHGLGIPDEALPRVFDPFFTSKPRDRGTGLGLSVSHGIVREHQGALLVESELGRWTRFHMDLPADEAWTPTPTPTEGG